MGIWRSTLGRIALVTSAAAACVLLAIVFLFERATRPPRAAGPLDPASYRVDAETVEFPSTDGLALHAWFFPAESAGRALPILLVHDVRSSKASLLGLALRLQKDGFDVLAFDLRGHGQSETGRSTYGLAEKRDVLGAVEYLTRRRGGRVQRAGAYGAGAGAHAVVLAATSAPSLRVLVLDGLYPQAGYGLARRVTGNRGWGGRYLDPLSEALLGALSGMSDDTDRAAAVLPGLLGRDVLFLAPEGEEALGDEILAMYESVPPQADADGNLAVTAATPGRGLYGDDLERHHDRVATFFAERLPRRSPSVVEATGGEPSVR
jgi:pimeloyl-ACP methyl ester carboxylesterase